MMADRFSPARGNADNKDGPPEAAVNDWPHARLSIMARSSLWLHCEAEDTTAVRTLRLYLVVSELREESRYRLLGRPH